MIGSLLLGVTAERVPQEQGVLCVLLVQRATGCGAGGHPGQSVSARVTSRKVAGVSGLPGEAADDLVVGGLGLADGQAGVDLERLAAGVPGVGLDQGIVDALL